MSTTPAKPTAIVTGASRGIGRAIAEALGSGGYNVVINYNANADAASEAARAVKAVGGDAHIVQADVGKRGDHAALVAEAVQRCGAIHLRDNTAGVGPKGRADLLEMADESWDFVLDTNLKGPFFLTQLVANQMVERIEQRPQDVKHPPAIINIGSISAYTASINRGEYCIAKAGMAMMTLLFADRLAPHDINVYELRPGIIATDMTSGVKEKYDKLILEDGLTPIRRWGKPEDVGQAVLAIAERRFPFSTGEVINVDGGFHMHRL
ncbi:MAG: 3-ketoacyl-ACP reductase [Phycisphaeraceae bacterium]